MLHDIWSTVVDEFSDIPDAESVTRVMVRLMVAGLLGGLIGYERERKFRSAGVRTHMLVCIGTALFVMAPLISGMSQEATSRILQGVAQGIGFLGAGAIILGTTSTRTQGLTTASGLWATAAIGAVAGLGLETTAILSTVITLIVLAVVPIFVKGKSSGAFKQD